MDPIKELRDYTTRPHGLGCAGLSYDVRFINEKLDDIEDQYIPLPKDKYGRTIHIGDQISYKYGDSKYQCLSVSTDNTVYFSKDGTICHTNGSNLIQTQKMGLKELKKFLREHITEGEHWIDYCINKAYDLGRDDKGE